jgi:hypothetical protein
MLIFCWSVAAVVLARTLDSLAFLVVAVAVVVSSQVQASSVRPLTQSRLVRVVQALLRRDKV